MIEFFVIFIVVMVSWVNAYVENYQVLHLKYVQVS